MESQEFELYTDFLIANCGQATATRLSEVLDGAVSHDKITRFLSKREYTSKDLWLKVKPIVRQIEDDNACLIFDDTIQEKPWMDENEMICWHFDHTKNRSVKGINLLNALYCSQEHSIPIAFELVKKPLEVHDTATNWLKRVSVVTKNEQVRNMIQRCVTNGLKFRYVLMDSWFAAKENFEFIVKKGKHFIVPLKENRLVALSEADKKQGRFTRIGALELPDKQVVRGWLKGFEKEVLLTRVVFTNKDGSTACVNLVCSDLALDGEHVTAIYKKRWKVEEFHKSLKSNASLAKSPARRVLTQGNHVFMSICAVFKLECLKIRHKLNHFALRSSALRQSHATRYVGAAQFQHCVTSVKKKKPG